jgi:hypothetical protein
MVSSLLMRRLATHWIAASFCAPSHLDCDCAAGCSGMCTRPPIVLSLEDQLTACLKSRRCLPFRRGVNVKIATHDIILEVCLRQCARDEGY